MLTVTFFSGRLPIPKRFPGAKEGRKIDFQLLNRSESESDDALWFRSRSSRYSENPRRIRRDGRDLKVGSFDSRNMSHRERKKKEIEIKVKLQVEVDPRLHAISKNNEDDGVISLAASQPAHSTRNFMKRDDQEVTSPTPRMKQGSSAWGKIFHYSKTL